MEDLDIFATDPEARAAKTEAVEATKKFERPTYDFQFRSGMMDGKQPVSLTEWRVITPKQSIADAFVLAHGGTIGAAGHDLAVSTESSAIEIVVTGPVESKLVQWADGFPIHECNGRTSLLQDDRGQPCGCPALLDEKKEKAKQRRGPKPNITIPFRLAHDYDLGLGKYVATAWTFAEDLPETLSKLRQYEGEVLCRLRLEKVEFNSKIHGKVKYTKPVLDVLGSYNEAITEDANYDEPEF